MALWGFAAHSEVPCQEDEWRREKSDYSNDVEAVHKGQEASLIPKLLVIAKGCRSHGVCLRESRVWR
jgi:hypothetical protein